MVARRLLTLILGFAGLAGLVACGVNAIPGATIDVGDVSVVYDGAPPALDLDFEPADAASSATIVVTPEGGEPLAPGVIPVDVGRYGVTVTLAAPYEGSATGTVTITPRPLTIVPDSGQAKLEGQDDPTLTFDVTNVVAGDEVTGELGREAGETIGSYAFTLGTIDAGSNYTLSLAADAPSFTIAVGEATITVDDAVVVYDGDEQALAPTFDPPEASVGATVTYGALPAGEIPTDVGSYAVQIQAGSGYTGTAEATLDIEPRPIQVAPDADQTGVYGAADPTLTYSLVDPGVGGPIVPGALNGTLAREAGSDVGTYAFLLGDLDAGANYALTLAAADASFEITPRALVLSGFRVDDKTYDGTTAATGAAFDDDRIDGDALTFSFDVAFAAPDATSAVDATFSNIAISGGADASNYALQTTSGTTSGAIARRSLGVQDVLWADKVYDGGTGATASATLVTTNIVSADDVSLVPQLVGQFDAADVGTRSVTGAFTLTGSDAANYVVDPQPTGSAAILLRPVSVTSVTVDAKPYDGTTDASVSGTVESASGFARGVLAQEATSLTLAARFATANAGTDVAVTLYLDGPTGENYLLQYDPLQADVTARVIEVVPDADQTKVYGESDPTFGFTLRDPGAGEVLPSAPSGELARATGETAGEYAFDLGTVTASANFALELADPSEAFEIVVRPITLTANQTAWTYGESPLDLTARDATEASASPSGLRTGDVISGSLDPSDLDVAGTNHLFARGTADIDGDPNDSGSSASTWDNYDVTFAGYDVAARPLVVRADDRSKTYGDELVLGTTAFSVEAVDTVDESGLADGEDVDAVVLSSDGATAAATVIGDGPTYPVTPSAATGATFDPLNYEISYLDGTLALQARTLTIGGSFTPASKPYDGTTDAGLEIDGLTLQTTVDGDDVKLVPVLTFDDILVATGKTVTLTDATALDGVDAGNYLLSLVGAPSSAEGVIVKRDITFDISNKADLVYDGSRALPITVVAENLPPADDDPVAYTLLRRYVIDATGSEVATTVSALDDAGTYRITVASIDARYAGSSNIEVVVAHRPLEIEPTTSARVYGEADPDLGPVSADGFTLGRDDAYVADGELAYEGSGVGVHTLSAGTVTIVRSPGGEDVTDNYAIAGFSTFEIVARPIAILADARTKVYGEALELGTEAFTVLPIDAEPITGLAAGESVDAVTLSSVGTVATATVDGDGPDYAITPSAATGSGGFDAANYAIAYQDGTLTVQQRPLVLTAVDTQWIYGETPDTTAGDVDLAGYAELGIDEPFGLFGSDLLTGELELRDVDVNGAAKSFARGTADLLRDLDGDETPDSTWANYAVQFVTYTVQTRPLTIVADDRAKTYGDLLDLGTSAFTVADPVEGTPTGLASGETVTAVTLASDGAAATATYATPGPDYPVTPSAATGEGGFDATNYDVTYTPGTLTIAQRPMTVFATEATGSKEYGDPDPTIVPEDGSTGLAAIDELSGALTYAGAGTLQNVGTYGLSAGTDFAVVRTTAGDDVTANYLLDFGDFEIVQKPVIFFIDNADALFEGVYVFQADGVTELGIRTASDPSGVTDVLLAYRRTHDGDYEPIPVAQQPVGTIRELGTYEVTMTVTNPNYVDATDGGTVRTMWVTDATQVAFTDASAASALVGATGTIELELRGADDQARNAGPLSLAIAVASDGAQVVLRDAADSEDVSSVVIAGGTSSATLLASAETLVPAGESPRILTATPPTGLTGDTLSFATEATLVLSGGETWPVEWQIGADVLSETAVVTLTGAEGAAVAAPSNFDVSLSPSTDVAFSDTAGTPLATPTLTIASGESAASFKVSSSTAATYDLGATDDGTFAGITAASQELIVTPKPVVTGIDPSTIEKAQTTDLVVTGSGFSAGVAASFSGSDVVVDDVTVDSPTQLTVQVTIDATTTTGTRDLTVLNPDGGTTTTSDAITLTVPTLSANNDGPFDVVEGGNVGLSIASDLLTNDSWSGTSAWSFDAVTAESGVTSTVSGDTLTVTAPTDTGGTTASLTYRITDAVFGTSATATVTFNRTYAPADAIVMSNSTEFLDFRTSEYSVPTFSDVFASWPRFDGASYYLPGDTYSTNASAWYESGGTIVQPNNVSPPVGFVSPDAFEYFTFEGTVYSSDADNDSIGLVAAFANDGASNVGLIAHRTDAGNSPSSGWGLTLYTGGYSYDVLAEPSVDGFATSSGWNGKASRIKVERTGDIIRIQASDWFTTNVSTATPGYDPQSLITLNLATGVVTYRSGTSFIDVTLSATIKNQLAGLRGGAQYGYFTYSQPLSTYYNITFEGGAALDTAIFLTDYDAGADAWLGSEVWRFTTSWTLDASASIQTELGFPRIVTSVAQPVAGSSYSSYEDEGVTMRILEDRVEAIR